LIAFKELPVQYRAAMRPLLRAGFTRVPSFPMTRLNIRYASFDEFLAKGLSKRARRDYRRKFKAAETAPPLEMSVVTDITPCVDEAYPLYLAVFERSKLHFEKLTKPFFCRLGAEMPDVVRFFIWRQQGKMVAFSLCMLEGDTLYDEYLGLDYSVALDLHLYFLTLRDTLTWAIERGFTWYYSSSLGYDPKLHLGCELVPLDLYVTHSSKPVNFVLRRVLPLLEPTHGDTTLRRFRNFHALRDNA
jgi:predicted N-acyltransferase